MRFVLEITASDHLFDMGDITHSKVVNAALGNLAGLVTTNGGTLSMGMYNASWGLQNEETPPVEGEAEAAAAEGM